MESEILELKIKTPAVIDYNREKLEKYLDGITKKYGGLVVTEDNLSDVGKTRVKLGKLAAELNQRFREVKEQSLEPIQSLQDSVKAATAVIDKLYRDIKNQEDDYDKKRRDAEMIELEKLREQIIVSVGVPEEYQEMVVLKPHMTNKSASRAKVVKEIESYADAAKMAADQDAKNAQAEADKKEAVGTLCQIYSEKYELEKHINPLNLDFNSSCLTEIEKSIERIAIDKKKEQDRILDQNTKRELIQGAGDQVRPESIALKGLSVKVESDEPAIWGQNLESKEYNIIVTLNRQQRIDMQNFFRNQNIKFKLTGVKKNEY